LLHKEIPDPTPVFGRALYTSDFSTGTDGWSLNMQAGASGTLAASGGKLNVSISTGDTEAWHSQLVKNNFVFEEGKLYRISFSGAAASNRGITFYAGKGSSPWSAYSNYNAVSITPEVVTYTFTFIMSSQTDPTSRLVFDLGAGTGEVHISGVKVEELHFAITSLGQGRAEGGNNCVS
jgi:hypothetical protein